MSPNPIAFGSFGNSVALSGNILAVGAPGETVNGLAYAGRVYIFDAKSGALLLTLISLNSQPFGQFGWSVSVSGDHLVVGAAGEAVNGQAYAGNAYLFHAKTGASISPLSSPRPQANGFFGSSVAVGRRGLVVGAYGETANMLVDAGHAHSYDPATGAFLRTLINPNVQFDGWFGFSVAISDETAVIGAPGETGGQVGVDGSAGNAYVYDILKGRFVSQLKSPNAQTGGSFGFSVSAAARGSVGQVSASALTEAVKGLASAGNAYVFHNLSGPPATTLNSQNPQANGQFGMSAAMWGPEVVVGAQNETVGGQAFSGRAYVFSAATGAPLKTLSSPNSQYGGLFGARVAIDYSNGPTIAVGAWGEFGEAGRAYVF